MHFLSGDRIGKETKGLVHRSGKLSAAVVYWGTDGARLSGIAERSDPKNVSVICDLHSGACNPSEIRKIMASGVQIKKLCQLHAKVWIGGDTVIVGSANASTNGLADDPDHIEAALMVEDRTLAHELQEWFDCYWCQASDIDEDDLLRAEQAWERRTHSTVRARKDAKSREPDRTDPQMLKGKLIAQVVETAQELCRSSQFSENITDKSVGLCSLDPAWKEDYERYLGNAPQERKKRRDTINPQFGKNIRKAIGAKSTSRQEDAENQILGTYTPVFME